MKKYTTPVIVALLLLMGGGIYLACHVLMARHARIYDQLTVASNLQTDVVATFVQDNRLAHVMPSEKQRDDFAGFLETQVQAGLITAEAAQAVLEEIRKSGLESPIYTPRGWVLPLIVRGL